MKVCPTCQSRFDQGEEFCPSDGTELVDAREFSPGKLTGKQLEGIVELDELTRSDPLGERYQASLADSDRRVRVTVFNQTAAPREDRRELLDPLIDLLAEPIPEAVLAVHSVHVASTDPPFVVEESADGPDLRTLLDDEESLDWRRAARITAHLAQGLHWMGERGHVHRGLYPGAIHLEEQGATSVRIGDWTQAALTFRDEPMEAAGEDGEFVGFSPYLAPEALRDDGTFDERSVVYSLGMVFYELILGTPPFASGTVEETLKRHLHEKPLKLSIAASDRDLHPELDDVFGMMWAKEPSDRFQTPKAVVAALADLLGEAPQELAAAPEAASNPVFADDEHGASGDQESASKDTLMGVGPGTAAVGSDDGEGASDDEKSESVEVPSGEMGGPDSGSGEVQTGEAAIEGEERERTPSSDNPSIIIEDPELETAMSSDGEEDSGEESEAPEMNSWSDAMESTAQTPSDDAVVTGFVDAETGIQHNPDGESVPVSVQTRDLSDAEDESATSRERSEAPEESSEPVVEINPDAQRDSSTQAEAEPTAVGSEVKEEIEEAKRQLRDESKVASGEGGEASGGDGDIEPAPTSPSENAPPSGAERAPTPPPEATGGPVEKPESSSDGSQDSAQPPQAGEEDSDESIEEDDEIVVLDEATDEEPAEEGDTDEAGESVPPAIPGTGEEENEGPSPSPERDRQTEAQQERQEADDGSSAAPEVAEKAPSNASGVAGERSDVSDGWFEVTDEEAWMAADVREERDRSEMMRRYATWGFLILLLSTALFLIIYSQTYTPADETPEQKAEETADE